MSARPQPTFVCYIPGLDDRRLDVETTPYLASLRRACRVVSIRTLPSTELVPTLVSGTLPHENRVWQVSLREEFRAGVPRTLADLLPDMLVTTAQCMRHFVNREYDLAVIPRRRRRRFDLHRFKYTRRSADGGAMDEFSGYQSIFGLLGERSQYVFTKDFESLPALAQTLPTGQRVLEFLEMYALDLVQHWHLDNAEVMRDALSRTDRFVRDVHARCRRLGVRLVLLVDHGQEPVVGTIPLLSAVRAAGVADTEFSYFIELASARFWFHTERARADVSAALAALPRTSLLSWREMHEHQVCFESDAFGELYAFAEAGWIFFPHDFYQPIGNAVLGLMDRHQRQRARNPIHRGNHGYLPHHPSEKGWLLMDDLEPLRAEASLLDVAPSLLLLVGESPPSYMKGRPLFSAEDTPRPGERA